MTLFLENNNICEAFIPVDTQTGANTGDWVNLRNYKHVAVVYYGGLGTANDDPTITIQQAISAAGGSAKALNFATLYSKQAATNLQSTGTWTKITQAAANTYTNTTAAEQAQLWVVEFDSDQLDVDNGFCFIQCSVADTGAAGSQPGCCFYILSEPRFPAAPENMISALS